MMRFIVEPMSIQSIEKERKAKNQLEYASTENRTQNLIIFKY